MPADTSTRRIRLAAGSGPTFGVDDLACAAATHLRCWSDRGLEVEWIPARGGLAAMRMVLDGQADASYGGLGPVLQLRAAGHPVRIVASMARALAQNLVAQAGLKDADAIEGSSWAIDGIGALSHHMARCIVAARGLTDDAIDWHVLGPPPERIAGLLEGSVDLSLIRVEEALALTGDPTNDLHMLMDFRALKALVPVQPHGVLATTEALESKRPDLLSPLAEGIIDASRRLRESFDAFHQTYLHYVTVELDTDTIRAIWTQEAESDGFAVNGEMTAGHWAAQIDSFARLNPTLPRVDSDAVLARQFVEQALATMGTVSGTDRPES